MKRYHAPELTFEALYLSDILTTSGGGVATVGPTTATEPTQTTDPTQPSGGGIVLPEDTFG